MGRDSTPNGAPTRREYVTYGGTAIAGGLGLAGCLGGDGSADEAGANSHTVSIEPAGSVSFEEVPETYITYKEAWADIAVALGQADGLVGTDLEYGSQEDLNRLFFDELEGVALPLEGVTDIRGGGETVDKEIIYEIDADVHLVDPLFVAQNYWEWSEADVEEISRNVGPFFGSYIRRERGYAIEQDYEFYSLYEGFEKAAKLFDQEQRYEAFAELHDDVIGRVEADLPPEQDRPEIGLINAGSEPDAGTFYVLDPTEPGYEMKHYRDLGIRDAFADADLEEGGEADYETLLEYDPDQIFVHWGITHSDEEFAETFVEPMENHPVGNRLTAVQEGRVYKGGTAEQGPITNLFQTELLAQDQYPDVFGDRELFDRQRVTDIVDGNV
ncbi:hypothetical protein HALLA_03980 (plasmid) [Halostagnicola larsenii XH-48]|uniref:Fe/B12 periplasmic-binding domain-containing protein n=1 Tax=Halostagnicola larsenii XH-48 TaxID=797299 RepID=W0JWY4_9EURY|nr:ABC transporter substrate-binding protein [Halostagnicola larsenii]AHG01563.1 hypothetical protein HALLA_03980 [Halostagnicola larsenii XH-48]